MFTNVLRADDLTKPYFREIFQNIFQKYLSGEKFI